MSQRAKRAIEVARAVLTRQRGVYETGSTFGARRLQASIARTSEPARFAPHDGNAIAEPVALAKVAGSILKERTAQP